MKIRKKTLGIGLDIGSSAVKLVKLEFSGEKAELADFSLEPVQANLAESLKNIKEAKGVQVVNVGVCGPSTVIRCVTFPRMNQLELKQALKFEAQKHIPFAMEEINLDGVILQADLPENKMLVLVAAAKLDLIAGRLKLIEDAGLTPNIVDIDSLALVNAFNFNYSQDDALKNKAVTLLNIGSALTNLCILENCIPRLSRDIHIAGNNFTQKLIDVFGIDFKSAEELKLKPDAEKAAKITEAFESVVTSLVSEIRISFDYYESQSASSVAKIFLSGGASKVAGLKDMLANLLSVEVEYWDPLKQISLSAKIEPEKIKTVFSSLAVAVGLALRM